MADRFRFNSQYVDHLPTFLRHRHIGRNLVLKVPRRYVRARLQTTGHWLSASVSGDVGFVGRRRAIRLQFVRPLLICFITEHSKPVKRTAAIMIGRYR
jgi:hypothetical protein